jgi:hypothetical protein
MLPGYRITGTREPVYVPKRIPCPNLQCHCQWSCCWGSILGYQGFRVQDIRVPRKLLHTKADARLSKEMQKQTYGIPRMDPWVPRVPRYAQDATTMHPQTWGYLGTRVLRSSGIHSLAPKNMNILKTGTITLLSPPHPR